MNITHLGSNYIVSILTYRSSNLFVRFNRLNEYGGRRNVLSVLDHLDEKKLYNADDVSFSYIMNVGDHIADNYDHLDEMYRKSLKERWEKKDC